jgi:hypothetical protein
MLHLLLFILACAGGTQIIVFGKIFEMLRKYVPIFKCSMCTAFWFGIIIFTIFYLNGIMLFPNYLYGAFIYGCIGSGTSYFLNMGVGDDGINIKIKSGS